MEISNKEKAKEIAMINSRCYGYGLNCDSTDDCYQSALQAMQWKDEEYKVREEGLRETINALDANLQKSNESGMYYFNKCNLLIYEACKWLERNDSYAVPTNVQVDRLREYLNNIK